MMFTFASASPHISIAAEEVFSLFGFKVTNSIILGLIGYLIMIWIVFSAVKSVKRTKKNNKKPLLPVRLFLWLFETLYRIVLDIVDDKKLARLIAPLPITIFFFIVVQYWLGIIPFVGPISVNGVPIFRGLVADLNATFALAIITIVAAQIYAIKANGFFGNAARYLQNPLKDPIGSFNGILEILAEFSRLMGLSFRLFGNVFAGEILLVMVAFLSSYLTPIALLPFYVFELFIGLVQAYIFFMLTTVFISLGLAHHGPAKSEDESRHDSSTQKVHSPKVNLADKARET